MTSPAGSWTQRRAKWRRYRVGRTLTYVGIFLYLPVMVALTLAFKAVGWGDDALMWIAGVWMSACAVNGLWFTTFRCPECGKRFFPMGGNWIAPSNDWGNKCRHCGARAPA